MVAGMAASAAGSAIGGAMAAHGAKKAAKIQAKAMLKAQKRSQQFQMKQLGKAGEYLDPYANQFGGQEARDRYQNYGTTGMGGGLMGEMAQLGQNPLNMDYQSDPAYQWRQDQQEEMLDRALRGRRLNTSSYGIDSQMGANRFLSGQEADKQYGRATDQRNWQYQDLNNRYGLGYQNLSNQMNLGYGAASNMAGMHTGVGANIGGQMMQAGMGAGQARGQGIAQSSQMYGNMISGLGNMGQQYLEDQHYQPYIDKILSGMAGGGGGGGLGTYSGGSGGGGYNLGSADLTSNW